jgi:hypothetical protein
MICEIYYSGQDPMTEFEVELRLDEKELVIVLPPSSLGPAHPGFV